VREPELRDSDPLRLLLVEDTDDDAALVVRALRHGGFSLSVVRVQTSAEFIAALTSMPNLVISDHSLPSFSSTAALACLRERGLDIPFIVVSGTLDEEAAVTLLRAGAHDFVTKQNLARLGPAIRRELQEARNRAEHRAAQRELQVQRDFLRLVIDSNPNIIFTKDSDGRYTLANRATAAVFGTTPEALVGKTDADFNPTAADQFLKSDRAVISSGQAAFIPRESVTDARTGRVRWFETHKVPLFVPSGPHQVLGIGLDITERVAAEEALRVSEEQFRQAQKMEAVGELAAGIAHDFNNQLTAILGYAELADMDLPEGDAIREYIGEVIKAAESATTLTRQLLSFSRRQVLQIQPLNAVDAIHTSEKMLRRAIREDVSICVTATDTSLWINADSAQLEHILLNLVVNARDAMPEGGGVRIDLRAESVPAERQELTGRLSAGEYVVIAVADTGSGMTPDVQARLFEPFFTTKPPGKGTGLGLAMVHGSVLDMGGLITIASAVGAGTTLTMYFPRVDAAGVVLAQTRPRSVVPGSEMVLVVDDDARVRALVTRTLTNAGYTVLAAAGAQEALSHATHAESRIELLVTDVVMPEMSGPALKERLFRECGLERVLYTSGYAAHPELREQITQGTVHFVAKPFSASELTTAVRRALEDPLPHDASLTQEPAPALFGAHHPGPA
jgi:PAS domain S-box-containing protein